jgi:hypothetical protein
LQRSSGSGELGWGVISLEQGQFGSVDGAEAWLGHVQHIGADNKSTAEQNEHSWLMKHVESEGKASLAKTWPQATQMWLREMWHIWELPVLMHRNAARQNVGPMQMRHPIRKLGFATALTSGILVSVLQQPAASRALQKYMNEFHADRDHAMCDIQNRSIPVVTSCPLKIFRALMCLKSSQ